MNYFCVVVFMRVFCGKENTSPESAPPGVLSTPPRHVPGLFQDLLLIASHEALEGKSKLSSPSSREDLWNQWIYLPLTFRFSKWKNLQTALTTGNLEVSQNARTQI